MSQPLVSVVILTRDRVELFTRCLQSILANTYPDVEIIVFDNGSPDARRSIDGVLAPFLEPRRISHIVSPPAGFAAMRQDAFERAHGALIMSIDDDCTADPDAIAAVVRRFDSDPTVGIVGGQITNVGFAEADRRKGRGRIGVNGRYEPVSDPRDAEVFGSANMSVRRKAFDEAGGYDRFFSDGMEEADLALSIRRLGYRIAYESAVRITHLHTTSRFRKRWRNLDIMRIYLYLKHFMPRTVGEWLGFAGRELGLFARDFGRVIGFRPWRERPRGDTGRVGSLARALAWLLTEVMNLLGARLLIPYLAWRAWRARRTLGYFR